MKQYLDQLRYVLENGSKRDDRTGTGTIGVFGLHTRYNLAKGFPAVTTKRLYWKGVVHELLWMLKGDTNIKYLVDNGVHIWDDDCYRHYQKLVSEDTKNRYTSYLKKEYLGFIEKFGTGADKYFRLGNLGPVYGKQWREWSTFQTDHISGEGYGCTVDPIDQIANVIEQIKSNPYSRRHIVSAWNPAEIDQMALPPCHCLYQFYVDNGKLSCMMTQRSQDAFLGGCFNIASYALLTHMIAQVCSLDVGELIISVGDMHIYNNHIEQVKEQISRVPYKLPTLWLNPEIKNIDEFKFEDIKLKNYKCHKAIKAPLSVGI